MFSRDDDHEKVHGDRELVANPRDLGAFCLPYSKEKGTQLWHVFAQWLSFYVMY